MTICARHSILLFLLIAILSSGCPDSSEVWKTGRYVAKNGLFSCDVPRLGQPGAQLDQGFADDAFTVVFTDDFGSLYRVDGVASSQAEASASTDSRSVLNGFFESTLDSYRAVVPSASLEDQKFLAEIRGGSLYSVVFMPGGSTISGSVDGGEFRRLDAVRSSLVFLHKGWLVQVSSQLQRRLTEGLGAVSDADYERLQEDTLAFAQSIEFHV